MLLRTENFQWPLERKNEVYLDDRNDAYLLLDRDWDNITVSVFWVGEEVLVGENNTVPDYHIGFNELPYAQVTLFH